MTHFMEPASAGWEVLQSEHSFGNKDLKAEKEQWQFGLSQISAVQSINYAAIAILFSHLVNIC